MKRFFRKALDWLPFNGQKTQLSLLIAIVGVFRTVSPDLGDIGDTIIQFLQTDQGIAVLGAIGSFVGIIHKWLKADEQAKAQKIV